jgi:hypothetical protein
VIPQPLFVIGPPHGEVSRVAAMLGSHPDATLVPELGIALAERVEQLLEVFRLADGGIEAGLLRAVAELFLGGQRMESVQAAQDWLQRRIDRPTDELLWEIAERVAPRRLVVPDTLSPLRPDLLARLHRYFPESHWLHVTTHPRLYGATVAHAYRDHLFVPPDFKDHSYDPPVLDPQLGWLRIHGNIDEAFSWRGAERSGRLRAENLAADPERVLPVLCERLGWPFDERYLDAMLHPERSPYSTFGPPGAVNGLDAEFLHEPTFTRRLRSVKGLDGPLQWREDGAGFGMEVRMLADRYGYF